jgi:hypothetical protein
MSDVQTTRDLQGFGDGKQWELLADIRNAIRPFPLIKVLQLKIAEEVLHALCFPPHNPRPPALGRDMTDSQPRLVVLPAALSITLLNPPSDAGRSVFMISVRHSLSKTRDCTEVLLTGLHGKVMHSRRRKHSHDIYSALTHNRKRFHETSARATGIVIGTRRANDIRSSITEEKTVFKVPNFYFLRLVMLPSFAARAALLIVETACGSAEQ